MSSPFDAWIEDDEGAEPLTVIPDNSNAEASFDWYKDEDGDLFVNSFASSDEIPDEASVSSDPFQESNMEEDVFEEPEGYKKSITFADTIATPMGVDLGVDIGVDMGVDMQVSNSSLQSSLFFEEQKGSTKKLGEESEGGGSTSEDEEEEESDESKIKRQLMYTVGGVGFFALFGFGIQKIQSAISKNTDDVDAGGDVTNAADTLSNANDVASAAAGDGGSTYSSAASAAQTSGDIANVSFNTSASASQSNLSIAGFGMGGQGGGMSAVQ
jgi:hypothetical protein